MPSSLSLPPRRGKRFLSGVLDLKAEPVRNMVTWMKSWESANMSGTRGPQAEPSYSSPSDSSSQWPGLWAHARFWLQFSIPAIHKRKELQYTGATFNLTSRWGDWIKETQFAPRHTSLEVRSGFPLQDRARLFLCTACALHKGTWTRGPEVRTSSPSSAWGLCLPLGRAQKWHLFLRTQCPV